MTNTNPRRHTIQALTLADEGQITWQELAEAALKYLSDYDVKDLLQINDLLPNSDNY